MDRMDRTDKDVSRYIQLWELSNLNRTGLKNCCEIKNLHKLDKIRQNADRSFCKTKPDQV